MKVEFAFLIVHYLRSGRIKRCDHDEKHMETTHMGVRYQCDPRTASFVPLAGVCGGHTSGALRSRSRPISASSRSIQRGQAISTNAKIGPIPGWVVLCCGLSFYAGHRMLEQKVSGNDEDLAEQAEEKRRRSQAFIRNCRRRRRKGRRRRRPTGFRECGPS